MLSGMFPGHKQHPMVLRQTQASSVICVGQPQIYARTYLDFAECNLQYFLTLIKLRQVLTSWLKETKSRKAKVRR